MFIRNLFSFLGLGVLSIILTTRTSAAPQGVAQESPPAKAPAKTKPEVQSGSLLDGHLKRVETITSPTEMASSFFNSLRCDDDGNVYFRTDLDGTSGIHKLNKKAERVALFEANSNPDFKVDAATSFAVEPDGGALYELVFPHEINRYVFVYKPDGTFKSSVKLQPGFPFFPSKVAVLPGGQLLISGDEYDADRTAVMWPFTGIFAPDGRLLKELEVGDEKDLHDLATSGDTRFASQGAKNNRAVANGQIEIAADGNAYLMRWTNPAIFYAISAGGEVVRSFTVDPGEPAYRPSAMHIYKNRIAVLFVEPQTNDTVMNVVDLEGHKVATYDELKINGKSTDQLGASFACYTENPTRFTFLGANDDSRVQLWIAEPR
jgi:hypothetical protein